MKIKEAISYFTENLLKAGVFDPAFDTIYIFEYVLSYTRTQLNIFSDRELSDEEFSTISKMIERRAKGEPVQYILGHWYFMGRKYFVDYGVLIPRDDTEVLVRECMTFFDKNDSPAILDLCSGSGIIAVTLKKHFQNAKVTAVEKSDIAYSFLTKNCDENDADINCINGDLYDVHADFADNSLDLIVSNPPYIITDEIKTLQSEVQKEPVLALDGGKDGYDFYRGIIKLYAKKLKNGGKIAFEIGEGQYEYIKELLENSGFSSVAPHLDLGSTIRCVTAIYNS